MENKELTLDETYEYIEKSRDYRDKFSNAFEEIIDEWYYDYVYKKIPNYGFLKYIYCEGDNYLTPEVVIKNGEDLINHKMFQEWYKEKYGDIKLSQEFLIKLGNKLLDSILSSFDMEIKKD